MKQGDCFFNKPTHRLPSHPWVILSDPGIDPDNVLIVNLTDADSHHDQSCILDPSDHPGVFTKRSCVAYQFSKVTSITELKNLKKQGLLYWKTPVSRETLDKILAGAQETDELTGARRNVLRDQSLIS
jgi:hypothetical protein